MLYILFIFFLLFVFIPSRNKLQKGDKVTVRVCVCMCGLIVFSESERPSHFFYFIRNLPVGKHSNGSFDSFKGTRQNVQDLILCHKFSLYVICNSIVDLEFCSILL